MNAEVSLPSGTVTFLFTDIEDSSARWEAEPELMRVALARHDEILGEVVQRFGGAQFKHLGDGICAAFGSASAAVGAATGAQRALTAEAWPGSGPLRVRMGLHTGASEPVGGDYFGPPVNRAARVMGVAHGGQVVCSGSTAALCSEFDWFDHGVHELRGVGDEHLFSLLGDEPGPAPELRLVPVGSRVPQDATSFVGREGQAIEIGRLLTDRRLVTLVGVGGVGKTRLAQEVAAGAGDRFVGGVWWCELAPVLDREAMLAAVIQVVGSRQQPSLTVEESVAGHLGGRGCLVVLDNCEHLIDDAAGLAEQLLAVEGVTVLATSREPLAVREEQVFPVGPLGSDEVAIELFADRARMRDPSFTDEGRRESIREICERLDRIPLAIELAAARTRSMSPESILERLDDRFRLLRGQRRGGRHQTLRDAVNWSYELLESTEAALFQRLAVFMGSFSLDAAEVICSDGTELYDVEVLDALEALVDKSMVVADTASTPMRYRLLETMRQFAEEKLTELADPEAFRHRHLSFYQDLVLELHQAEHSSAEPEVWAAYEADWDNIRAAHSHALATRRWSADAEIIAALASYILHNQHYEAGAWAEALLNQTGTTSDATFADVHAVAAMGAFVQQSADQAIAHTLKGLEINPSSWKCFNIQCTAGIWKGDRALVKRTVEQWENAIHDTSEPVELVVYHLYRAMIAHSPDARPYADMATTAARRVGSPTLLSHAHWASYFTLFATDPGNAMAELHAMGAEAARSSPRHINVMNARTYEAELGARVLKPWRAMPYCRDAITICIETDHQAGLYSALQNTAHALKSTPLIDDAIRLVGHIEAAGYSRPATDRLARELEELAPQSYEDRKNGTVAGSV